MWHFIFSMMLVFVPKIQGCISSELHVVKKVTKEMKRLGSQRQWSQALKLLETLRSHGGSKATGVTCAVLVKACALVQQGRRSEEVFTELVRMKVQADVFTYSALIGAFSRGSDFSKALQHFQAMEVAMIEADVTCFTSLLSACEKTQRVSDALEIFESMKARKVMPNHVTYSSLISCCEESSQVDLAWDFFNEMKIKGVKMDTIVYNALISTLEKGRRGREALDLLQEMKLKEVCPNVISYNAVLSACEKSRMWEEALEIFQELLDVSLKPDLCSYNALISAADKCQKCHVALVAFEDMKVSQLQADLITYNALISACRSSHPLLASEFFTSMIQEELQPDVISYIALGATKLPKEMLCTCDVRSFTAQLGRIQVQDVLPFYQEMRSRGLQMDGPSYAVLFNILTLRSHPSLPWLCDEMRQDFLLRGGFPPGPYRENGGL